MPPAATPLEAALQKQRLKMTALIEIDPQYYRPAEVDVLIGDPSKAKKKLGWNPNKTSFKELVRIMAKHDLQYA